MFGQYICDIRKQKNISQIELSRLLNVSASYLNQLENEKKPAPLHFLEKLSQVFGLTEKEKTELFAIWHRTQEEYVLRLEDNPSQQKIRLARKIISSIRNLQPAQMRAIDAVLDTACGHSV